MGQSTLLVVFFSLVLFGCTSLAIRQSPGKLNLVSESEENTNNIGYFMSLTNDQPIPEALEGLIPTEITAQRNQNSMRKLFKSTSTIKIQSPLILRISKKNFERKPNLGTWFYTPKASE